MKIIRILILGLLLINTFNSTSQKLNLDKNTSKFTIKGTSSLHDWEMVSEDFVGTFIANDISNGTLDVQDIDLTVIVKTLKSGKKVMDRKCYDALKCDANPNIKYDFKNIKDIKRINDNTYEATLNGTLTIAGQTKPVLILVTVILNGKTINIKGEKALKMSDFEVVPPTALLGTIKTGNNITIQFNLNYI